MKKTILLCVTCVIIASMTMSTFAVSGGSDTVDAATLDALYQEHLDLRDNLAELTDAQADYLLALGVSEDEIHTITNGEVADLLKSGTIKNPEYLEPYIDEDLLIAEAAESKRVITEGLEDMGLDSQQIETFFENRFNISEYSIDNTEKLMRDLKNPPVTTHPRTTSCNIFTGTQVQNLLGENPPIHFHSSAYPTTITVAGRSVSIPRNPTVGTEAYTLKCDLLASHLSDVSLYAKKLYNQTSTSGIAYNYYLYAEESSSTSNSFHEGIDTQKGKDGGATLKNIATGKVIAKATGNAADGSANLSKLLVYNSTYDVTIQYLHLNIDSTVPALNSNISAGATIGTEGRRGAASNHTHIQITSGQSTNIPAQDPTMTCLDPYSYLWMWCK